MFPLLPEKSTSDFLETAGSALPQWVHTGWGMCFSSHNIKPTKVNVNSVDCLIRGTTLQKCFGKQFKKQRAHSINQASKLCRSQSNHHLWDAPEQAHSKETTPWNPQDPKDLLPKSGARYHRTPPWTLMFIPRRVKALFSFFFSFFVAWGGGILLSLGFFLLHKTFYL